MKKEFYLKPVRKNKLAVIAFLSIAIVVWNCGKKGLDENIAAKIYVEKILIEEKYSYNLDSIKFYNANIFKKHQTDSTHFNQFLAELGTDQHKWEMFFKEANNYLAILNSKNKPK